MDLAKKERRIAYYTRKIAETFNMPPKRRDSRHKRLLQYKEAMNKQLMKSSVRGRE